MGNIRTKSLAGKIEEHEFRQFRPRSPRHGGDRAAGQPHRRAADRPGVPGQGPGPPGSRTGFLEGLGVEIARGDLTDPAVCDRAVDDVSRVFHCAAKVGDWGSWQEFQVGCIDATRTLAEAAARAGVERFVHISSTSAYGHPPDQPTPIDETAPLGQNIWVLDHYTRSKVECERLLWDMAASGRLPLTVIRPSWLFGERDRTTIPRLIQEFRWHRVSIVGKGR